MDTDQPGTSQQEASRQAETINAYWAERGMIAGARVVRIYDERGTFLSYGVASMLRLAPSLDHPMCTVAMK